MQDLTINLEANFAEGHPAENDRSVWLDDLPEGALVQEVLADDDFLAALDMAVADAARRLGYEGGVMPEFDRPG